jgi:hypothetical protein
METPFQELSGSHLIRIFLSNGGSVDKVLALISGELPDIDVGALTFTYGNGELIVSHDSDEENSHIFYADCYNGVDCVLVEG